MNWVNMWMKIVNVVAYIIITSFFMSVDRASISDGVIKTLLLIIQTVLPFLIVLWTVWIIYAIFLMTRYGNEFIFTLQNFIEVKGNVPTDGNPRLVLKSFIKNKQVELSSAKTFLNNKFLQEADGRLQWTFGYPDIHKELEVRNVLNFDKIIFTILPSWTYLSWFPLVPQIEIVLKIDTPQLVKYIETTANSRFKGTGTHYIEFKPFTKDKIVFQKS